MRRYIIIFRCGCEIDLRKKDKIKYYLKKVKKDKLIGTSTAAHPEKWTKRDLSHKMEASERI